MQVFKKLHSENSDRSFQITIRLSKSEMEMNIILDNESILEELMT